MAAAGDTPLKLRTVLGDHPHTAALKDGRIRSDLVALDFVPHSPTHRAFKPMVREQAFDVCEMAVVTHLMAKGFGKPMVLLPAVMLARLPHRFALRNKERPLAPGELAGKRVGIRSFTTTTGAWLRGILADDHGLDLEAVRWVSFEDPHVAEYRDTTERAPAGKNIVQMLVDGELDAVIGETSDDPRLAPLFAAGDAEAWYARHQVLPVNHMVVVRAALAQSRPDAVREVYRLLTESRAAAQVDLPFGIEANRRSLELIVGYAARQGLIPRAYAVDELFDDTTHAFN